MPLTDCSEEHRAACEARYVADMQDDETRAGFLAAVEKKRGREAAQALRNAAWQVIRGRIRDGKAGSIGNRGMPGM